MGVIAEGCHMGEQSNFFHAVPQFVARAAGALDDRGVYRCAPGTMGPMNDDRGR